MFFVEGIESFLAVKMSLFLELLPLLRPARRVGTGNFWSDVAFQQNRPENIIPGPATP
jgi:hypothetical protein